MTNNKQKAKRVERQAAKMLSDKLNVNWERTVFSGSMSTHRDNDVYKGDIHCTEEDSEWAKVVGEVKSRKDSVKLQEIFSKKSKLVSHIEQAIKQTPEDMEWFLLVKVNYEGWFLVCDKSNDDYYSTKIGTKPTFLNVKTLGTDISIQRL